MSGQLSQQAVQPAAQAVPAAAPPGWYADPLGGGGQRYWDGIAWSEQFTRPGAPTPAPAPAAAAAPEQPPAPAKRSSAWVPLLLVTVVLLLAGGVYYQSKHHPYTLPPAWQTAEGRAMYKGFIRGCEANSSTSRCRCVFTQLTSAPPFDTPQGFTGLAKPMGQFLETGDFRRLPDALVRAGQTCA